MRKRGAALERTQDIAVHRKRSYVVLIVATWLRWIAHEDQPLVIRGERLAWPQSRTVRGTPLTCGVADPVEKLLDPLGK